MSQLSLVTSEAIERVLKLTIAYDGTDFHGFAAQRDQRTVEGVLTHVLARVLRADRVELACAGRTDAGVHAWGQVVSVPVAAGTAVEPDAIIAFRQLAARARGRGARGRAGRPRVRRPPLGAVARLPSTRS